MASASVTANVTSSSGGGGGGGGGGASEDDALEPRLFRVTKEVIQGLRLARSMSTSKGAGVMNNPSLNSIDFHNSEMLLVAADDTDALSLYDVGEGQPRAKLMSQKYGLRNVTCTRSSQHVLHSSKPSAGSSGDVIRYWSLQTNTYVRYFPGHRAAVTSLCTAPDSDEFMSAGMDRCVFVWDLRKKGAAAVLPAAGAVPYAQYDHQGLVAAIATEDAIRLFDVRCWSRGPFIKFTNPARQQCTCLRFSNDGGKLLCVSGMVIKVLDAIVGSELFSMNNRCKHDVQPEACFDPSSQFVLSGCQDGYVRVWSAPGGSSSNVCGIGENIATLPVPHSSAPRVLKWAPTCLLVASGSEQIYFWIPDVDVLAKQYEADS